MVQLRSAGYGHDERPFRQKPGQGEPDRRRALALTPCPGKIHDGHVRLQRLEREERDLGAAIFRIKAGERVEPVGEQGSAGRAPWDETDAKLFANIEHTGFRDALKKRVFALDGCHWLDGMGAMDSGRLAVFLGFPIWGMSAPPVTSSFLARHDLSGKALVPFITHGGYGLGNSLDVVRERAPQAQLIEGFSLEADQERRTLEQVTSWLGDLTLLASSIHPGEARMPQSV